jgi:hypothetical protein
VKSVKCRLDWFRAVSNQWIRDDGTTPSPHFEYEETWLLVDFPQSAKTAERELFREVAPIWLFMRFELVAERLKQKLPASRNDVIYRAANRSLM